MKQNGTGRGARYRCCDWELDLWRGVLLRSDAELPIRPKALALLSYLIQHRGRVVPRQELLAAVWPDARVSDATLASTLRALREALGDPPDAGCVQTLRGRGYRFEGPVEEVIAPPLRALAGAASVGAGAALEAPFVGRGDLLAAGDAALAAVESGRGRALLLAGEAGIGKSRGLFELSRRARGGGFGVHAGRCLEEEGAPACWPWVQILRQLLEETPETERDARVERHAEAFALLPEIGVDRPGSIEEAGGAAARFRLFDAVTRLVGEAARDAPRVLVLDDLHRADVTSALLLRHALGSLAGAPVLLLAALRDREIPAGHPVAAILAELHGAGARMDLSPLDVVEVGELAGALGGRAPSLATARALHDRTGGNPLFVSEVARDLAQDGGLASPEAVLRSAPRSIREVIRSRVSRLPGGAGPVLEAASVFGREFELEALRRLFQSDAASDVDGVVDAAAAADLLAETAPGSRRLRFAHILVRDVLYDDLALERRTLLHRDVGRVLEALHPLAPDTLADELAYHFEQAAGLGEAERAQRYARIAGERALANAAYGEGAERIESALRSLELRVDAAGDALAPDEGRRERASLLVLLGRARWLGGDTVVARRAFEEAARIAAAAGEAELQARAALGYAGRTDATPGVNRSAVVLMGAALERLPEGDSPLRAELMARLGTELYYAEDPARCDELTREALAMAERVSDDGVLAYALSARHFALLRADVEPRRRLELTRRLDDLAARTGQSDVLALGLQEKIVDLLELGDVLGLDAAIREFEGLAEQLRQPFFRWMASAYRGMRAMLEGRVEEAERLTHRTLEIGQGFGTPNALPLFAGQLFCVRREQGRLHELEPLLAGAVAAEPVFLVMRAALAEAQTAAGRHQEARDSLARVMARDLDDVPRDQAWIGLLSVLTTTAVTTRDLLRVEQLYALLEPYRGRLVSVGHGSSCDGAVDLHLGRLAFGLGDLDAADAHLDAAAALHRRAGARLWLAHTQRDHAAVLWKSGAPHEREQARELVRDARSSYAALGLPHWEQAARDVLR